MDKAGDCAGLVLAGGRSRRMGGTDKALVAVAGRTLLERAVAALAAQTAVIAVSANAEPVRGAVPAGVPALPDPVGDFAGPLAGILAGLEWARDRAPGVRLLATVPVDAPLFPADLIDRLRTALDRERAEVALAASDGRRHPVFALWPVASAASLRRALIEEDMRRVGLWAARFRIAVVEWPALPYDPFLNVNTPDDLRRLERLLSPSGEPESWPA